MKTIKKFMITVILAAAMIACLSGCSGRMTYTYKNANQYRAGDREISEKIENIDIDYLSGSVTLVGGNTDKVSVKETASKKIDDKLKVHTWVDGSTLHVRYCVSAKNLDITDLEKDLVITVPSDTKLESVGVDSSSANINVDCSAEDFKLEASSGNISLVQHGGSEEINAEASSGNIDIKVDNADKIDIEASSGNISVDAKNARKFKSEASSGSCEFRFAEAPEETDIDASAGNVSLYLPEDSDITIDAELSGGQFNSEIPFTIEDEKYIIGSGADKIDIEASAGDVFIKKY